MPRSLCPASCLATVSARGRVRSRGPRRRERSPSMLGRAVVGSLHRSRGFIRVYADYHSARTGGAGVRVRLSSGVTSVVE